MRGVPDLTSLKRVKGDVGYKVAAKVIKKMMDGYIKSCFFMKDYEKIKSIGENIKRCIDERNQEEYDKWCMELNYYTNVKPKVDREHRKELRKREKIREKVKEKLIKKIKKEGAKEK